MNNRSPRVVAIGRKPRRNVVGDFISQIVMPASMATMHAKNTATGSVHTIQSSTKVTPTHTRPIAKPFAM